MTFWNGRAPGTLNNSPNYPKYNYLNKYIKLNRKLLFIYVKNVKLLISFWILKPNIVSSTFSLPFVLTLKENYICKSTAFFISFFAKQLIVSLILRLITSPNFFCLCFSTFLYLCIAFSFYYISSYADIIPVFCRTPCDYSDKKTVQKLDAVERTIVNFVEKNVIIDFGIPILGVQLLKP